MTQTFLRISEQSPLDFTQMDLPDPIRVQLAKLNFTQATPIQACAIPEAIKKNDCLVISQTGTGKTLAYAIPIARELLLSSTSRALVLLPSREMAFQVFKVFESLLPDQSFKRALIVSGTPNKEQVSLLKKNPRLIIATPGRMNEHLANNKLLLQSVSLKVIDEADRMLDLGFGPQLQMIKKTMRGEWQTMMIAASVTNAVENLALKYMRPDSVLIKTEMAQKPVNQLKQKVFFVDPGMKNDLILSEIKDIKTSVLIFASLQPICEELCQHLADNGISAEYIHGALSPGHRNRALQDFIGQKTKVLVTTDLLARGIDIPHIECVISYDLPPEPEDFLHRIGRTARAGRSGLALTLISPKDHEQFEKIKIYLEGAKIIQLNEKTRAPKTLL